MSICRPHLGTWLHAATYICQLVQMGFEGKIQSKGKLKKLNRQVTQFTISVLKFTTYLDECCFGGLSGHTWWDKQHGDIWIHTFVDFSWLVTFVLQSWIWLHKNVFEAKTWNKILFSGLLLSHLFDSEKRHESQWK